MRSNKVPAVSFALLALAASACASSQSGAGSGSLDTQAATGKIGPAVLQWTGSFRATQQQSGTFSGQLARNQASGSVVLTAPNPTQIHVVMQANVPVNDPERLPWDIAAGTCGTDAIPLLTVAQFPELSVSNGGGSLDEVITLAFPTTGTYHVNLFQANTDGSDQSDVMACANLSLGKRSS